jgi:DNA-directed RNA polymerase specialized sigma24 family protein
MMTAREQQREAAAYLSRYRVAQSEVKDIERRIERVRNEMMGVKGIDYTGGDMPKQQNRTGDLSDYMVRIDDLIQDWKAAQDRAIAVMREVSLTIDAVQHDQARRVLMLHFVDGLKYEKIAEMVPCGIDTVYRWRRIGLSDINVNSQ